MKNLFPCFFKVRRKIIKKNKSTDAQAKKKDRSFGRDISNLPVDKEKCKPINLPQEILSTKDSVASCIVTEGMEKERKEPLEQYRDNIRDHLVHVENNAHQKIVAGIAKSENMLDQRTRWTLHEKMREMATHFKLKNQTLFLAYQIFDRYTLEMEQQLSLQQISIMPVVLINMSGKFQEIYPPRLAKFSRFLQPWHNKQQIVELEAKILIKLDYDLCQPTSLTILESVCLDLEISQDDRIHAQYAIQAYLMKENSRKFNQSVIAHAALHSTSQQLLLSDKLREWGKSDKEMEDCLKDMVGSKEKGKTYQHLCRRYNQIDSY